MLFTLFPQAWGRREVPCDRSFSLDEQDDKLIVALKLCEPPMPLPLLVNAHDTPRRTSNRQLKSASSTPTKKINTPTKPVEAAKPLGPYDNNSVRDRIRKWQEEGGGVITASDILVEVEEGERVKAEQEETEAVGVVEDPVEREPRRRTEAKEDKDRKTYRSRTPKKRVVSDAHWRKKKSPPKERLTPKAGPKSERSYIQPDESILEISTEDGEKSEKHQERLGDDGIRIYPSPAASRVPSQVPPGDGIRVYASPPASQRHSEQHKSVENGGSDLSAEVSDGRKSKMSTPSPTQKTKSVRKGETKTSEKEDADKDFKATAQAAREEARRRHGRHRSETVGEPKPARSSKAGILNRIFSPSSDPVPVAAPRIPSVENWLQDTPDPFVDEDEPPVEMPAPLSTSSSRRRKLPVEESANVPDPNAIWDSLDKERSGKRESEGRRRRRMRKSGSPEAEETPPGSTDTSPREGKSPKSRDVMSDAPDLTPAALKRSKATRSTTSPERRRRPKSSPLKESFTTEDTETAGNDKPPPTPTHTDPLRPVGLFKRPFPSTGAHRLSTIASVETFRTKDDPSEQSEVHLDDDQSTMMGTEGEDEARDIVDLSDLPGGQSGLKRKLTTHADLISVLSLPKAGNKSVKSARSIRTNRSRLATATVGDLMQELATDESKYMRELRTLVDGVIPVLLTCVLSKSDSAAAAGLFNPSMSGDDPNFTRPIVDMGVALERMKTLHRRIPQDKPDSLLLWAQGAQKVYAEYLRAWRLGFQDVVVNLAPAEGEEQGPDDGLPRDENGDIVNGDGERVDVAFLLKRPLVRLKYLSKTFRGINTISPSRKAEEIATAYQELVEDARRRSNEERARLEDEAASSIDATRARDPRTLAPLTGVRIDPTRRVRARDYFNLCLPHSSGQIVDCQAELLLRDDAPERGSSGDLLICEVDGTGRWLLLPPILLSRVSARNGDSQGEIVLMIRGLHSHGEQWQELLSLKSDDEEAGFDWIQMLGLEPVPPKLARSQSFLKRQERRVSGSHISSTQPLPPPTIPTTPIKSRTPSPTEIEVPFGETTSMVSKVWTPERPGVDSPPGSPSVKPRARLHKSARPHSEVSSRSRERYHTRATESPASPQSPDTPRNTREESPNSALKRSKAKRLSRHGRNSPLSPPADRQQSFYDGWETSTEAQTPTRPGDSRPVESLEDPRVGSPEPGSYGTRSSIDRPQRPEYKRATSSVPSMDLPNIPKIRKNTPPASPTEEKTLSDATSFMSRSTQSTHSTHSTRQESNRLKKHQPSRQIAVEAPYTEDIPVPPQASVRTERPPSPNQPQQSSMQPKESKRSTPKLPPPVQTDQKSSRHRRTSSPLKHQYEPSTASDSSSDSDASTVQRHELSSISDSSEDELEDGDVPTPLLQIGSLRRGKVSPPSSLPNLPGGTLGPSSSASQAPYKTVPAQPTKSTKMVGSIFCWSEKGMWESLHPDECSIVITPGMIEAFEMSAAHSRPAGTSDNASTVSQEATRPLVALELTPLVPLRRGTALDISIRSPPTKNSRITTGNNVMFRSRTPEECEALYNLINHARINNPTYIALQNARPSYEPLSRNPSIRPSSRGGSGSWLPFPSRNNSYRAKSAPTPSIAPTESSIGSMSSAFSALKRFGNGGRLFNISRSTISSRQGGVLQESSRSNSIYSSTNSSGSGAASPALGSMMPGPGGVGLSNAKVRLYKRETASKWRDMGSARLTVMPVGSNTPILPNSRPPSSSAGNPRQGGGNQKRVICYGKTKGEVLLDAVLGESSFERIARTGIAVSVWEDDGGVVGAIGGVAGGTGKVYMIQVCIDCLGLTAPLKKELCLT